jgi:hypothetical protein
VDHGVVHPDPVSDALESAAAGWRENHDREALRRALLDSLLLLERTDK